MTMIMMLLLMMVVVMNDDCREKARVKSGVAYMTKKSHAKWICSLENVTMHRYTVGVLMPCGKESSWPNIKLQVTG